jgi:glycosyltransferase involved in cell wall biosynthesis
MKKTRKPSAHQTAEPKTLHYAGFQPGANGFGWATCNRNLRDALGKHFTLTDGPADIVFMPLTDHDFNPATGARGKINVAYSFFEFDLGPKAAENAKKYDVVFVGSTWCQQRCAERGIHNTKVLIQGVDQAIFQPEVRTVNPSQFRIFSGGKFEWRKGQDLVIRAFGEFLKQHPDGHLVCAWHNPWPGLAIEAAQNAGFMAQGATLEAFYEDMLARAGIPPQNFTILPQLTHEQLAHEMTQTDCALFPNRCEGGTNLVLMEYASTGGVIIANTLTGHADVEDMVDISIPATEDASHWAEQSVSDIVEALGEAHRDFRKLHIPEVPTWEDAAQTVKETIASL